MKIQVAYDTLAAFLEINRAGLAEIEALKALVSYAKGVETRELRNRGPVGRPPGYSYPAGCGVMPYSPTPVSAPTPASTVRGNNIRGVPWTEAEDAQLRGEFASGFSATTMASNHGRTIEAIAARLVRLNCIRDREDLPGYIEYRQMVARTKGGTYTPKSARKKNA